MSQLKVAREIVEFCDQIKTQGAAAERARIRAAVAGMPKFKVTGLHDGWMVTYEEVLSLLKDGDGSE